MSDDFTSEDTIEAAEKAGRILLDLGLTIHAAAVATVCTQFREALKELDELEQQVDDARQEAWNALSDDEKDRRIRDAGF